jgi:nitroreductase
MDALEAILQRRSVRDFAETPVSDEQVETLLRAAMAAPSAGNQQSWRFVIVREPDTLQRLAESTRFGKPMGRAQVGIVVLGDEASETFPHNWPNDCATAAENILIAAHAIGLGACWLGVHPGDDREAAVGAIVGTPEGFRTFCMIAVGVPARRGPKPDRYDETRIRYERWTD